MKLAASALAQALALLSATAVVTAAPSGQIGEHSLVARGCTSSTQCASTKYCDNGACRSKVEVNATCRKDQMCKSGLCYSSKCVSSTSRPNGAACTASTLCSSGNCQNSKCAAKKGAGGSCYKDVNCSSGKCNTKTGKCAAGSPTPSAPAAGNTKGAVVYKPTPASSSAAPTAQPTTPGSGETTDVNFNGGQGQSIADTGKNVAIQTTSSGGTYLQATVSDGGSASYTVPVSTPVGGRKRQLPDGMIVNYQYQLASMTVADPNKQNHCYIHATFSDASGGTLDDFERPFGVESVSQTWQQSSGYGSYANRVEPWTSYTITVRCEPGVTAVLNTATVSHEDGPTPTIQNWYPTPTVTPTANVEEFTNGGFESGDLTGWSVTGNVSVVKRVEALNNTYEGQYAAQLSVGGPNGQTASLYQVVSPRGAPQQRRQVGMDPAPSPFNNLRYNQSFRFKTISTSDPSGYNGCSYYYQDNGKANGVQSFNSSYPGWLNDGDQDYPIYYLNNDIAKSFSFGLSCPSGISMTMNVDAFSMVAQLDS